MSNRFRDIHKSRCFLGDIMPLLQNYLGGIRGHYARSSAPVQQELSNKYIDESSVQDAQEYQLHLDCVIQTIKHLNKIEIENGEQEDCSVCLCGFVANTETWILSCNHKFHSQCILKWPLDHNRSCPLCRCQLPNAIAGRERVEITPYFLFFHFSSRTINAY
ncbi:hypothetical protein AMTRI_Chr12g271040 [Amborella trichopoda]